MIPARLIVSRMTETELMEKIRSACKDLGLLAFHDYDSRRSWGPGFPDLVVAGPRGVIFRECKDMRNQLSPDQRKWRHMLAVGSADYGLWRPSDLLDNGIARELESIS